MKQVIQNFKTGELYVDEVPKPSISKNMVLVENKFSLISAGTERGTVKVAKASLIGKAKQRPDLVAQVLQNIRKEGLKATLAHYSGLDINCDEVARVEVAYQALKSAK
jgi:polar amino acid transport system substrate-binding protein